MRLITADTLAKQVTHKTIILNHANKLIPNYQVDRNLFNALKDYFLGKKGVFDLNKGLYFQGKTGTGKTTIMKIFRSWLYDIQSEKRFNIYPIRHIERDYKLDGFKGLDYYTYRTTTNGYGVRETNPENICIDDAGAESAVVQNFGDKISVFSELIQDRYELFIDKKIITHITSNIPAKELKNIYTDQRIIGRINEMFNFVNINTINYRPQDAVKTNY